MVLFWGMYRRTSLNFTIYWKVCIFMITLLYLGTEQLADLAAKEEERVWVKRQTDGELDDSRLTEGLTGEATVYKRRSMAKPEQGRPQIK